MRLLLMIEMHDAPTDVAHNPAGPQRVRAALAEESLEAAGGTAGGGEPRSSGPLEEDPT